MGELWEQGEEREREGREELIWESPGPGGGAVVVIASLLIKRCKAMAFRVGVFREMSRMIVFLLFVL
jgi:hypothetical protein